MFSNVVSSPSLGNLRRCQVFCFVRSAKSNMNELSENKETKARSRRIQVKTQCSTAVFDFQENQKNLLKNNKSQKCSGS